MEKETKNDPMEQDRELASLFTQVMLRQEGARQSLKQLSQQDPNAPAMIAAQAMIKARELLIGNGMEVDDSVWVAGNGVLDDVLEDIADDVGIPDNQEGAARLLQMRTNALKILEKYEQAGAQAPTQQKPAPAGALGAPPPMAGGPSEGGMF